MFKKLFLFSLVSFLFVSCQEQVIEEVPQQQTESAASSSSINGSLNNGPNNNCRAFSAQKIQCLNQHPNAAIANIVKTCNANGVGTTQTPCVIEACLQGFALIGNNCIAQNCIANTQSQVRCESDIANAAVASKMQRCNANGLGTVNSSCIVQSCSAGFYQIGNSCLKQVCLPGQTRSISCVNEIANANIANSQISCNSGGNGENKLACQLIACKPGYNKVQNRCELIAQNCTPNSVRSISCVGEIINSNAAVKNLVCSNSGMNEVPGICNLVSCKNGFKANSNNSLCEAIVVVTPTPTPPAPTPTPTPPPTRNPASGSDTWFDISQSEQRELAGINSEYGGIGQSCSDWLAAEGVIAVGTSSEYKDAARLAYYEEKKNNSLKLIDNYQDWRDDHYRADRCVYRWNLGSGVNVCRTGPFVGTKTQIASNWEGNQNFRPVAQCNNTSNWSASKGQIHEEFKLHVKVKAYIPSKNFIPLDHRYLSSHGQKNTMRGNDGESAYEFFARLNIPITASSNNLYYKQKYYDIAYLRLYKQEVAGAPIGIDKWKSRGNRFGVTNQCPYEVAFNNNKPFCQLLPCGHKDPAKKPVLTCHLISNHADETKGEAFLRYDLGLVDTSLAESPGLTLDSAGAYNHQGISTRVGPSGISTKKWLNDNGITFSGISTYRQVMDAADTHENLVLVNYLTKGVGQVFPEGFYKLDRLTKNQCPYEIRNKATNKIFSCEPQSCDAPTVSSRLDPAVTASTYTLNPVMNCVVESNWGDVSKHRGFLKYSVHIDGLVK